MRDRSFVMMVGVTMLVAVVPVVAHHAFSAEFDGNRPVKLSGKVTKVEWVNPHSWIHIDVIDKNKKVVSWMIEAGAPNALFRRGFRKDSLPIGTEIVIEGFQAKSGLYKANGKDLTFPDGRKLFMGSSGTGAPYDKPEKAGKE